MVNYLVIVYGFFGDIAFSTSVARKLLEEKQCDSVDYLIGLPQMKDVLDNDKNISNVFVSDPPGPYPKINIDITKYNKVIKLSKEELFKKAYEELKQTEDLFVKVKDKVA